MLVAPIRAAAPPATAKIDQFKRHRNVSNVHAAISSDFPKPAGAAMATKVTPAQQEMEAPANLQDDIFKGNANIMIKQEFAILECFSCEAGCCISGMSG